MMLISIMEVRGTFSLLPGHIQMHFHSFVQFSEKDLMCGGVWGDVSSFNMVPHSSAQGVLWNLWNTLLLGKSMQLALRLELSWDQSSKHCCSPVWNITHLKSN